MKYICLISLAISTSCSMMPFIVEEVEQGIEFEQDAIRDEMKIREQPKN